MEWKKVSKELAGILEQLLIGYNCVKKPMFGCPVYFINDNMFAGVKADMVFIRLSENDRAEIIAECDEVSPFEPRPDFIMKEYINIPESQLGNSQFISKWLRCSYEYVASLPSKEKKLKKKK
jgi:TfoX/Sxy family transcriptional regulator of competence genes